ncbi:SRPBCC domain-containing protein [Aestuariibaculum suncheonense]|uniref:SRPBCC domain-containing protein n=1 Tax=Aestuariibaculum suncheonense TaxID=1028745 RepID=A0A8J6QFN5_9FLAO|nr:SRPBCC domain-containing protein [Aestuariibaculum suncheonense]MBD0835302.1 SRPBCC domain-containing protein [Aestuariibaculum suncheonense]
MLHRLSFKVGINAKSEMVWNVLWGKVTYPQWTKIFSEDSQVETDWVEGSTALFTDGKGSGMRSRIYKRITNEFMGIEHLGMLEQGVELPPNEKTKDWLGAKEDYTLTETNGVTTLEVGLDTVKEYESYFYETFPKALQIVKDLSENK